MIGNIIKDFMAYLGSSAYSQGITTKENRLLDAYHAWQYAEDEERILKAFKNTESALRLLVCTVAFGKVIYIPDIRNIFHWGCSNTSIEY